jgi:hypothetical protein
MMKKNWIDKIREHARDNYEVDGWSYVIESFSDTEMEWEIENARCATYEEALKVIHDWCKLLDERDKGF